MKLNALEGKNKAAIQSAIHDHVDLLVDEPTKMNRLISELILLKSFLLLSLETFQQNSVALTLLFPLSQTLSEYFDLFSTESLMGVVNASVDQKLKFYQSIKSNPEDYINRVIVDKTRKRTEHAQLERRAKRRRLEDKVLQLPTIDLSETQIVVLQLLMDFLDGMSQTNLLQYNGFEQLNADQQANHVVTRLLNHKLDDIPLRIYLEKGHVQKLLEVIEIEQGRVSMMYLLCHAVDNRAMSSSSNLIQSLLIHFNEQLYLDSIYCMQLAFHCYSHQAIDNICDETTGQGISIPLLLSSSLNGIALLVEYSKLFDLAQTQQQCKMLPRLSRDYRAVDIIAQNMALFSQATRPQQRSCLEGLSFSDEGLQLIESQIKLLKAVSQFRQGNVVLRLANTDSGIETLEQQPDFFNILTPQQQRRLLRKLSESSIGVNCLNQNIKVCLKFFANTKELVLSKTFLLNIIEHDEYYQFFQHYLLSHRCWPHFQARFHYLLNELDDDDKHALCNELSLTEAGVNFLFYQLGSLFELHKSQQGGLWDVDFITNILNNDKYHDLIWGFYYHPLNRAKFIACLKSNASLQCRFLSHYTSKRLELLILEPPLLHLFKPSLLMKVKLHPDGMNVGEYLKNHHPHVMKHYPGNPLLCLLLAKNKLAFLQSYVDDNNYNNINTNSI